MRNYKMTIAYDGTKYQGWQRQSGTELTIQETLEKAISGFVGYSVQINGSGRTDSGVHAWGQTADVKLSGRVDEARFRDCVNSALPEDIKIRKVELVKNGFHSRFSAVAKKYEYTIDQNEKPCVFTRKYCCHYVKKLNVEEMKNAAAFLVGTHDFGGFTDKKDEKSTVRTIYNIEIIQSGGKIKLIFHGNGFMYHMVRILTGTLLEVGSGEKKAEAVQVILKTKTRADAGFLAPAAGLCLKEVIYHNEL